MREASAAEAVPLLARVGPFIVSDSAETLESIAAGGRTFVVEQDGEPILAYTLERQGNECFILAAAGLADFDLTAWGLELVAAQAAGLGSIAFQTRRPGLIRKAERHGYRIAGRVANGAGVIMRKVLKP